MLQTINDEVNRRQPWKIRIAEDMRGDAGITAATTAGGAGYTIRLPWPGTWQARLNTDWSGYDPCFGNQPSFAVGTRDEPRDGLPWSGGVGVGAYSASRCRRTGEGPVRRARASRPQEDRRRT